MKKVNLSMKAIVLLAIIGALFDIQFVYAQDAPENEKTIQKKIIIKEIDDNGNEKITVRELDGDENIDIDAEEGAENQNFSFISIDDNGGKPYLGVGLNANSENGVEVERVRKNSPAEKAGIKQGDRIVAINGAVVKNYEQLMAELGKYQSGQEINLDYSRKDNIKATKVMLGTRDTADSGERRIERRYRYNNNGSATSTNMKHGFLGVTTDKDKKGVKITDITANSAAYYAAFERGDIIYKVDDKEIDDTDDLVEAISSRNAGDMVDISYYRKGEKMKSRVRLGGKQNPTWSQDMGLMMEDAMREAEDVIGNSGDAMNEAGKVMSKSIKEVEKEIRRLKDKVDVKKDVDDKGNKRITVTIEDDDKTAPNVAANDSDTPEYNLSISVFPNQENNTIQILFDNAVKQPITITIADENGKEVFREAVNNFNGSYNKEVTIPRNEGGDYTLQIQQGETTISEKIRVKK
ncbi:MAG: PDZ domain-containing protein [Saprospiraceae bacterium]|nr:PDZ domain-containing protein [Saprospiraceae bacterium]MBP7679559.1 PDZ domain-containing protein [Saprospiraceae bacterium]